MKEAIIVNTYGTVVRKEPDISSKVIGSIEVFVPFDVIAEKDEWLFIRVGDKTGYIHCKNVVYTKED